MAPDNSSHNGSTAPPGDEGFASARNRMVTRLEDTGKITQDSTSSAMRAVPRHAFVPDQQRSEAYADRPLGIGEGQTISAPHMVAMMTDLLEFSPGDRVLEIGTGCGYHAAVTAAIVGADNVYSVEYHDSLATQAKERLAASGFGDVSIRVGDGNNGWEDHAPYDAAYLTCAPQEIPAAVLDQVRDGLIVAPVGARRQELVRLRREDGSTISRETHGGVRFVRMRSE